MYGYLLWVCTVAMWWYDPTFLIKFKNFSKRQLTNMAMNAIEIYSDMTHKRKSREMIKDGYHVDFVFLIVDLENKIRRIDITSIFRREVLKGTFDEGCPIYKFVNLCCTPNSNLKSLDLASDYRLELNYTYDHKHYTIWFEKSFNNVISFPIYEETKLNSIISLPRILSAVLQKTQGESGIDITKEINEVAGPMGNFYDDIEEISVLKKWVFPNDTNFVLTVIDNNANIHTFDKTHKFLTFKKNE